jgi:tyrosine-protein kinase Etk/Wzc
MNNNLPETIQNEDEIDLLDLIGVLFKHKLLIILITTIAMLGVLTYSIISLKLPPEISPLPNLYKPVSTVRINESSSSSGLSSMLDSSGLGSLAGLVGVSTAGGASESAFAIKLATSKTITDQISKEFDLKNVYKLDDSKFPITDLRKQIQKSLSVEEDSDSGTISISYEDIDRDLATKIVNRVVDILEQRYAELDQTSNTSQRLILEEKISDVEQEISLLQQKILNFQNKYDILDAQTIAEVIGTKLVTLRTSLVEKDAAIATYQAKSRIEDPALLKLKDEKKALENALWALEHGTIQGIPAIRDLPLIVMEYEELTRSLEVQVTVYKTLVQQSEILKLQDGGTGPKFQIIEYAEVPEMKSGPSRGKLSIIVTFAAFFLSIFIAFLKEFWVNLKQDPERMKKLKGEV